MSLSLSGRGRKPATLAGSSAFEFNSVIVGENSASRAWSVTNTGDLATGALTVTASSGDVTFTTNTCVNTLAASAACSMNVLFHPLAAGSRSATITVHDSNGNRPDAVPTVTGTGQVLPSIGQACTADSRYAQGGMCENSSNGTSRVCCGADCTGNQSCSQSQNFRACELPTVLMGAACAAGTNTCAAGSNCNDSTRPGICYQNGCTGACSACTANGACVAVPAGSVGRCGAGLACNADQQCQCLPNTFQAHVHWLTWPADPGFDMHFADVDGDLAADIIGRMGNNISVGISDKRSSFKTSTQWGTWAADFDLQLANANGDRAADLMGRSGTDVEVAFSTGTVFSRSTRWGTLESNFSDFFADVDGDGKADLVVRSGTDVQVAIACH